MRLPLLLKILTLSLLASSCESEAQEPVYQGITYPEEKQDGTLRILAIGNSFSLDMAAHLPRLVSDAKADSVVVAVASVSGTDLAYHRRHLTAYDATYTFATSTAGEPLRDDTVKRSLPHCLDFADWDVIVIQQLSAYSGRYETIRPHLATIVRLLKSAHPRALIAWQMTWAYASYYQKSDFNAYDNDRQKMEDAIERATRLVGQSGLVDIIVPTGRAIAEARRQNVDTTGRELSRDGRHLSVGAGRYVAACCAWEAILAPLVGATLEELPTDTITLGRMHVTSQNCHALRKLASDALSNFSPAP